jgi:SARP family transcriptional regulator, regulator of embCAB operon
MIGFLCIDAPNQKQRIVEVDKAAIIGTDADNHIVLDDQAVSRCHALVLARADGVVLIDLGSANGTFVNDAPAPPDEPILLKDGDRITIGPFRLHYEAPIQRMSSYLDA